MRILWYNWKDISNPAAGGAEVLTHEIAKRLVKNGYNITLFCASYPKCKQEEDIDGVRIIRNGGRYSVYFKAKKYYYFPKHYLSVLMYALVMKNHIKVTPDPLGPRGPPSIDLLIDYDIFSLLSSLINMKKPLIMIKPARFVLDKKNQL